MLNELALFAGAGGGLLGTHLLGWRPVCAVEIEPYCREILMRRQRDGVLPLFPIWDDIRTFDGRPFRGVVDIVTAGFPCQPFSVAGAQRRESDDRNFWPDTARVLREVRPKFALLENVPGLLACDYFGEILSDLDAAGFDARWDVVSAAEVGAPHLRKRLWILANARGKKLRGESRRRSGSSRSGTPESRDDGEDGDVANADSEGRELDEEHARHDAARGNVRRGCWEAEPEVGRVVDELADRVDRLRALGNGQVPAVVVEAWRRLNETLR